MSDQTLDLKPLLLWPSAVGSVLIAAGLVVTRPSLVSVRPGTESAAVGRAPRPGFVEARLWEDPLEAVNRGKVDPPKEDSDANPWLTILSPCKHALILPVFMTGGGYSESAELRRRTRFAVVSALSRAGYAPDDATHLRYVWCAAPQDTFASETRNASPWVVPAEAFVRDGISEPTSRPSSEAAVEAQVSDAPHFDRAYVLWVDEADLGEHPSGVVRELLADLDAGTQGFGPRPSIRVIGPTSSDLFAQLIDAQDSLKSRFSDVAVISPWATVPAKSVVNSPLFQRRMALDDQLCAELRDELDRRRVWPRPGRARRIAVLYEWDTNYGRSIATCFRNMIEGASASASQLVASTASAPASNVSLRANCQSRELIEVAYLRGIDGLHAAPPAAKSDAKDGGNSGLHLPGFPRPRSPNEPRSEGNPQLDYLSRVEDLLYARDGKLCASQQQGISAIGIFGTDVYDKLLILRALRPLFPGAVFFTTDLDARLLHPAERQWTHNLVVASAFGLRLNDELQGSIPPFRDTYQTSTYFAVLSALAEPAPSESATLPGAPPRLFEVSRDGAFDLSAKAAAPHPADERSATGLTTWRAWIGLCVILIAAVLTIPLIPSLRGWARQGLTDLFTPLGQLIGGRANSRFAGSPVRSIAALSLSLVLVVLIFVAAADQWNPEGEPFVWFGGISVWPTVFLRFGVGALCLVYIITIAEKLKIGGKKLEQDYFTAGGPTSEELECRYRSLGRRMRRLDQSSAHRRFLRGAIRTLRELTLLVPEPAGSPSTLWRHFQRLRSFRLRTARVLLLVLLALAMFFGVFLLDRFPSTPGRGCASFASANATLVFSVGAMLVLIYLVLDITRLGDWMVKAVFDAMTLNGPMKARDELAHELGVARPDDAIFVDGALRTQLAADLSATIDRMIYLPFVAVFLMGLTRHPIFDNWDWPLGLVFVFIGNGLAILFAAFLLRYSAQRGREVLLANLRKEYALRERGDDHRASELRALQAAIDRIANERRGAFSPLSNDPIIRALLIPTGGFSFLALFEQFVSHF